MKKFQIKDNKIILSKNRNIVGFIEFKVNLEKNEVTLLETYVKEKYRGEGYGEELYSKICKEYKNFKINIECSYLRKKEENRRKR